VERTCAAPPPATYYLSTLSRCDVPHTLPYLPCPLPTLTRADAAGGATARTAADGRRTRHTPLFSFSFRAGSVLPGRKTGGTLGTGMNYRRALQRMLEPHTRASPRWNTFHRHHAHDVRPPVALDVPPLPHATFRLAVAARDARRYGAHHHFRRFLPMRLHGTCAFLTRAHTTCLRYAAPTIFFLPSTRTWRFKHERTRGTSPPTHHAPLWGDVATGVPWLIYMRLCTRMDAP